MPVLAVDGENVGMNAADHCHDPGAGLLAAARNFHAAAERPGSHALAPRLLASLEESLQVLSGAWYGLAADAARFAERRSCPEAAPRPENGVLSREQEVRLMATLHDVAAAVAGCARVCRNARSTALSAARSEEAVPG
jgi:hypothetical protein